MSMLSCSDELVNFCPLSKSSSKVYEPEQSTSVFKARENRPEPPLVTVPATVPLTDCGCPLSNRVVRPFVQLLLGLGPTATSVLAAKLVTAFPGCAPAHAVPTGM